MEAAEVLAGLYRCSSLRGVDRCWSSDASRCVPQDQPIAAKHSENSSTLVTEKTIKIASSQLCGTAQSNNKVKKKLTEAEKEARRVQRVLANRESARQTICRRQAMHLELTRKVNSLSEENKNLQKEKELALKNYKMLKDRNKFLKLQIANKRNAESKETQEQKSSGAEPASSASKGTSTLLYNQPLVPLLWSPVLPFPNVLQFQYPPNTDVCNSSHNGQGISLGNTGPANTFYVLPVPWLLPFHDRNALYVHNKSGSKEASSAHQFSSLSPSDVLFFEDSHQPSSRTVPLVGPYGTEYAFPEDTHDHPTRRHPKHTFLVTEMSRCFPPVEHPIPMRHAQAGGIKDANNVCAPEHISHGSLRKDPETITCPKRKSDIVTAAAQARRRRREVMQMKNVQNHQFHMQSTGN